MVSMAKIVREDRNLTQDDELVWEDMMQVMELERDIANVSSIYVREYQLEKNMQSIKSLIISVFLRILQVLVTSCRAEMIQSQLFWGILVNDWVKKLKTHFKQNLGADVLHYVTS